MMGPKVSIIINCYNNGSLLPEAIESALAQTLREFELLIVDDCSTDQTSEIAKRYQQKTSDVPIRILRMDRELGPSAARTYAVEHSVAPYLLFLDADDRISPYYLMRTVDVMDSNPRAGYVYVDAITFGDRSQFHHQYEYDFSSLIKRNFFAYCSLIRRAAFDDVGGYDPENWGYAEDWDLWLRLGEKGWHPIHISEPLFYYRIHRSSLSEDYSLSIDEFFRAFIMTRHPDLYGQGEISEAQEQIADMPEGWHRKPPIRDVRVLRSLIEKFPRTHNLWLYLLALRILRPLPQRDVESEYARLLQQYGSNEEDKLTIQRAYSQVTATRMADQTDPHIKTTVFILTIGDSAFARCEKAIREQDCRDFRLEFVAGVRPFSAAFREMIDRCRTQYLIEVDEDMILYCNAVRKMQAAMDAAPENVGMILFYLYDEDRERNIHGVKIWRTQLLKDIKVESTLTADMEPLEQLGKAGGRWMIRNEVLGRHGVTYTPETIYLRYKSMYENAISAWNIVTSDIRKKADRYRLTGDPLQLFALLGAAHGILDSPRSLKEETKDFQQYNLKVIELFKRLLLDSAPYVQQYDSTYTAPHFSNIPLTLDENQSERPGSLKHWIVQGIRERQPDLADRYCRVSSAFTCGVRMLPARIKRIARAIGSRT